MNPSHQAGSLLKSVVKNFRVIENKLFYIYEKPLSYFEILFSKKNPYEKVHSEDSFEMLISIWQAKSLSEILEEIRFFLLCFILEIEKDKIITQSTFYIQVKFYEKFKTQ